MGRRKEETILSAVTATGAGTAVNVEGYDTVMVQLATASSCNATIKFQASLSKDEPSDWSAGAAVVGNEWDYIEVYDLEDSSSAIDGDTGIVLTGTDDVKNLMVNTSGISWLNAIVTARSAGAITVRAVVYIGNE